MVSNFPSYYPYAITFGELLARYALAAAVYLMLATASWLLLHRFMFSRDWKAFWISLTTSSLMIIWPLAILPYLRLARFEVYLASSSVAAILLLILLRALWQATGEIRLKEKHLPRHALLIASAIGLAGVSIFAYIEYTFDKTNYRQANSRLEAVGAELSAIQAEAAGKAAEIAQDPNFLQLFKQEDFAALTSRAREIINEIPELNALAVTDRNGITLVAPHNPLLVGTDLTLIGPEHAKVLGGEPRTFLERAISVPLVIGAGAPLKNEGGEVIGAVFLARLINRDFALELAEKTGVAELGIYSNYSKVYVSTIRNPGTDSSMQNFFQLAFTDPELKQNKEFVQNLSTGEAAYTAAGKILTNAGGEDIGLLITYDPYPSKPLSNFLTAITVLAALTAIGIFLSPLVVHRIIPK